MKWEKVKVSKSRVIDADVARAAGRREEESSVSAGCANFFTATYEMCHKVVMTDQIKHEWRKHSGAVAKHWRQQMRGARKVRRPDKAPENKDLREAVRRAKLSDGERENLLKDIHLVEAALVADRIIVSLDGHAQKAFSRLATERKEIRKIVWVNPAKEPEKVISWLQAGAEPEKNRMLGSFASLD